MTSWPQTLSLTACCSTMWAPALAASLAFSQTASCATATSTCTGEGGQQLGVCWVIAGVAQWLGWGRGDGRAHAACGSRPRLSSPLPSPQRPAAGGWRGPRCTPTSTWGWAARRWRAAGQPRRGPTPWLDPRGGASGLARPWTPTSPTASPATARLGPSILLVGVNLKQQSVRSMCASWWYERDVMSPLNIHEAQLQRRLAGRT